MPPKPIEWMPPSLAGVMIAGLFMSFVLLSFHEVPKDNLSAVNLIVGAIIGSATTVVSFYFGSSKSSQSKDETIQAIAKE